jgi:hypothetical protein
MHIHLEGVAGSMLLIAFFREVQRAVNQTAQRQATAELHLDL